VCSLTPVWWETLHYPSKRKHLLVCSRETCTLKYGGLSFLYFLSNYLSLVSLYYVNASTYQLVLSTKIVFVAGCSVFAFGRGYIRTHQWYAALLISIALVQRELAHVKSDASGDNYLGSFLVIVVSLTAALSNVYNQLLLQENKDEPIMVQNSQLYVTGVVFNAYNWYGSVDIWQTSTQWIGEWNSLCTAQVLFFTIYGLVISFILKRFGAMVRTIIGCLSLGILAFVDHFFLHERISVLETSTFVLVAVSTMLYTHTPTR